MPNLRRWDGAMAFVSCLAALFPVYALPVYPEYLVYSYPLPVYLNTAVYSCIFLYMLLSVSRPYALLALLCAYILSLHILHMGSCIWPIWAVPSIRMRRARMCLYIPVYLTCISPLFMLFPYLVCMFLLSSSAVLTFCRAVSADVLFLSATQQPFTRPQVSALPRM